MDDELRHILDGTPSREDDLRVDADPAQRPQAEALSDVVADHIDRLRHHRIAVAERHVGVVRKLAEAIAAEGITGHDISQNEATRRLRAAGIGVDKNAMSDAWRALRGEPPRIATRLLRPPVTKEGPPLFEYRVSWLREGSTDRGISRGGLPRRMYQRRSAADRFVMLLLAGQSLMGPLVELHVERREVGPWTPYDPTA